MQFVYVVLALAGVAAVCQADAEYDKQSLKACLNKFVPELKAIPVSQLLKDVNERMQSQPDDFFMMEYGPELKKMYSSPGQFERIQAECAEYLKQHLILRDNYYVCMRLKSMNREWADRHYPDVSLHEKYFGSCYKFRLAADV